MQTFQFTGRVEDIGKTQTFSSGFTKCRIVVDDSSGRFPNPVPFDAVKEAIDKLRDVRQGDKVRVAFNVRGREYNGKVYSDLNLLDIEVLEPAGAVPAQPTPTVAPPPPPPPEIDMSQSSFEEPPF